MKIIKARLKDNVNRKVELVSRLRELSLPVFKVTGELVRSILESLDPEGKTEEEQRAIFSKLGLQVEVYPDRVENLLGKKILVRMNDVSLPRHHHYPNSWKF